MKFIDENLDLAALGSYAPQLFPILFRRNIKLQSFDVDGANVHGRTQQAQDPGAKAEFVDANQRLYSFAVNIRIGEPVNHQAFTRNH